MQKYFPGVFGDIIPQIVCVVYFMRGLNWRTHNKDSVSKSKASTVLNPKYYRKISEKY